MITCSLSNEDATEALARRLAAVARPGDQLALIGALGMGKTAFARAFIRHLTHPDEEVPSPTFTLVQSYDTACGPLWHCDLYRLAHPDDVLELGLDEVAAGGILLIEWPERAGSYLGPKRLDLMLAPGPTAEARVAILTPHGGSDWLVRFTAADSGPQR